MHRKSKGTWGLWLERWRELATSFLTPKELCKFDSWVPRFQRPRGPHWFCWPPLYLRSSQFYSSIIKKNFYLAVPGLICSTQDLWCLLWHEGSSSLTSDWTQPPLHWECIVLATGPPGKSLSLLIFSFALSYFILPGSSIYSTDLFLAPWAMCWGHRVNKHRCGNDSLAFRVHSNSLTCSQKKQVGV